MKDQTTKLENICIPAVALSDIYFFKIQFNLIKAVAITKYLLTILTYKQCMVLTLLTKLYSTSYTTLLLL